MSLTAKPLGGLFVRGEDVDRKIRRLARFDIEVVFGTLNNQREGTDEDRQVAFFFPNIEEAGWTIRLSPTATEEEQLDALHRAFECISNPETHPWWKQYPEILHGTKDSWGMVLHAPRWPNRHRFAESLAKEIEEFVLMKVRQASPSMLGASGYYDGGMRPHSERFDDTGSQNRAIRDAVHRGQAHVAGEIRAEMARQFKTPAQLAELLNLTAATVRRSLKGTRDFRSHEVAAVAEWLEVDVDDLVTNRYGEIERS